MRAVKMRDIT